MKESDLAKSVIAWLSEQHWEVYQEVQTRSLGPIADIIAVQGPLVWVIECKTTLSLSVMEQASSWHAHYRSVAIPCGRNRRARLAAYKVAKQFFKVGVLSVTGGSVNQIAAPPYMREHRKLALRIRDSLEPEHQTYAEAGNAEGRYWTPYKRTIRDVQQFLGNHPGATMKEIQNEVGRAHYASPASCRGNLGKALELWEDWCFVDRESKPFKYYIKDEM